MPAPGYFFHEQNVHVACPWSSMPAPGYFYFLMKMVISSMNKCPCCPYFHEQNVSFMNKSSMPAQSISSMNKSMSIVAFFMNKMAIDNFDYAASVTPTTR